MGSLGSVNLAPARPWEAWGPKALPPQAPGEPGARKPSPREPFARKPYPRKPLGSRRWASAHIDTADRHSVRPTLKNQHCTDGFSSGHLVISHVMPKPELMMFAFLYVCTQKMIVGLCWFMLVSVVFRCFYRFFIKICKFI